ncbi:hypothetical protein AGLY_014471 [Aphis glycines]|uniref:Uncharacterized protein n=1 Tax=Aphis glycines TaxID=307491 RepID=A0A6G0T582_APHGL|nr:hypothetical protein AGLY_014471 [Aphis glycines]
MVGGSSISKLGVAPDSKISAPRIPSPRTILTSPFECSDRFQGQVSSPYRPYSRPNTRCTARSASFSPCIACASKPSPEFGSRSRKNRERPGASFFNGSTTVSAAAGITAADGLELAFSFSLIRVFSASSSASSTRATGSVSDICGVPTRNAILTLGPYRFIHCDGAAAEVISTNNRVLVEQRPAFRMRNPGSYISAAVTTPLGGFIFCCFLRRFLPLLPPHPRFVCEFPPVIAATYLMIVDHKQQV